MQLVHGTRIIVDSNAPQQSPYVICSERLHVRFMKQRPS